MSSSKEPRFMTFSEMMDHKPDPRKLIAGLLRTAARILDENPDGERDESAAWRVADAGLELRELMESHGCGKGKDITQAINQPTGYGAELPRNLRAE